MIQPVAERVGWACLTHFPALTQGEYRNFLKENILKCQVNDVNCGCFDYIDLTHTLNDILVTLVIIFSKNSTFFSLVPPCSSLCKLVCINKLYRCNSTIQIFEIEKLECIATKQTIIK